MKIIKVLIILLLMGSASYAQRESSAPGSGTVIRLDGPVRKGPKPLYVIVHEKKEYELDSAKAKNVLNPDKIKSMHVVMQPALDARYKEKGKNGVILITLNEENNSAAFKELKQHLTLLQTEEEKKQKL
jgi:hypothetical protein